MRYKTTNRLCKRFSFPEMAACGGTCKCHLSTRFLWQVGQKTWQVAADGRPSLGKSAAFFGKISKKIHYLFTRKALYLGFSGRAERKKRLPTGRTAPTALRPRATCPTCHRGICQGFFFVTGCRLVGSVIFERPKRWCGRIRGRVST